MACDGERSPTPDGDEPLPRLSDAAHLGRPKAAGLFYAACSDNDDEDVWAAPISQRAAESWT
jgi:hypothetical protein